MHIPESPQRPSLAALGLLAAVSAENKLTTPILAALRDSLSRANSAGFGAEDWSTALGRLARHARARS